MKKKIFLFVLLISIVFTSLCVKEPEPVPSGGGGGGGGGGPPSCSVSLSLTSTGKDTCTITATITASYCDNKSYEIKNGGSKCSGMIIGNSFSKECSWTVSYGNYNYGLYVNGSLTKTLPIVCKQSSTCSDGTFYDECSATKPLYCSNGNLVNKCSFCNCPSQQLCNETTEVCYSVCDDNTPYGQCSISKPKYCDNGNLIDNCTRCGCLVGQNCNSTSEKCYTLSNCSGSVILNLTPSTVESSGSVIPSTSGLSDCNNKIIFFKNNSCSGTQVSSCTLTDGGCTGSSFTAPSNEGLYTYYACIDKNDDGDFSDSGEYSSKILNVTENNREHILNYLDYNLEHGANIGLGNLVFTLDSYELLGVEAPNKTQIINYLNSLQSDEGTGLKGQRHYVPITAQVLMFYNRSGVRPPKSLDTFFSTVDTWEEVNAHVNKYEYDLVDWGGVNYWGGLW